MAAIYTEAQLQALKNAVASGTLEVQFADQRIRYQSTADLLAAIAVVENELNTTAGVVPNRLIRVSTNSGY